MLVREEPGKARRRSREGGGRALQQRKLLGTDKAAKQQEGLKLGVGGTRRREARDTEGGRGQGREG